MSEILTVNKKTSSSSGGSASEQSPNSNEGDKNEQLVPDITEARPIFQAVGVISGEIHFDEEENGWINIGGNPYALGYPPPKKPVFLRLKKFVEAGQSHHRLLVYPRAKHFPEKEKHQEIYFQVVKFITEERSHPIANQLNDNEFVVRGLWQFIPVCRIPCISVYRNKEEQLLQAIKKANPLKRYNLQKPTHLPFLWKDAPIKPFRYNPKAETQDDVGFVQVKAKFLPRKNAFTVESLINMPQMEAPPYLKIGKKDKEKAVKMMQGVSLEEIQKQEKKEQEKKQAKQKSEQQEKSENTSAKDTSQITESDSMQQDSSVTTETPSSTQRKGRKRPVKINGIEYGSIAEAAQALGMKASAVSYRLKSDKHSDWYYLS